MIAEGGHETSLRKTGYGGDQIPCKKKKSPPEMNQPAGNVTIKERALSTLDIAILFQVVQEIPGRVGPHSQPVQVMVTVGKIHHVLPVAALAVKPAASRRRRTNSEESEAAILPTSAKIYICLFMPIIFAQLRIFVKQVVPECWRNSTVLCRE